MVKGVQKQMPESTASIQTSHSFSLQHLGGVGLEGVEVLTGLGLSGRQARVYLALLRTGDARVQTVASWAGVHRQEMYRLLDELSALGLVERHLTAPFTFRATPIEQGIKLLLHQKTAQWNNICLQAKQLSEKFSQCSPPPTLLRCGLVLERYMNRIGAKNIAKQYRTQKAKSKALPIGAT